MCCNGIFRGETQIQSRTKLFNHPMRCDCPGCDLVNTVSVKGLAFSAALGQSLGPVRLLLTVQETVELCFTGVPIFCVFI